MRGNESILFPRWWGALLTTLLLAPMGGCGTAIYLSKIGSAKESLEEARELGAEEKTPYEYYSAQARLEEAKYEAAHAEYGDAIRLANESRDYSRTALQKILDGARTPPSDAADDDAADDPNAADNDAADELAPPAGQSPRDSDQEPTGPTPVVVPPTHPGATSAIPQPTTGDDT